MDVAQNAVTAYKESVSTAEVYTADGYAYKGLPGKRYGQYPTVYNHIYRLWYTVYHIPYLTLRMNNWKKHRILLNQSKLLIDFFSLEIYTWRRKDYENGR